MNIAFDAATRSGFGGSTPRSMAHTCSTGVSRALWVGVVGHTTDIITGVTYNGVAMTLVGHDQGPSARWHYLFRLENPASGTHDVVVSASSSVAVGIYAASYTGVSPTGQPDSAVAGNATSATAALSTTTVANNCWTIMFGKNDVGVVSAGAGTTVRLTGSDDGGFLVDSNSAKTPAGSVTLTATIDGGSGPWVATIASFKPDLNFAVTADAGAYALTGAVAALLAARRFAVDAGSYALTGAVATFRHGFTMLADAGSYVVTGSQFIRTLRLAAVTAAFVITGALAGIRRVTASTVGISIAGTDQTGAVRLGSIEVEDVLNDAPNRCTFTCAGLVPLEGQAVSITRGVTAVVEFAGHILSVQQIYEGILQNVAYHVTCQDYTWKFDRDLVTWRWVGATASEIAQTITATWGGVDFTYANIVAGLPVIPEFECVLERPSRALTRLCAEFGGNWYIDYTGDVHVFITEATDAPDDLSDVTLPTTTARGLRHTGDLVQVRTRVVALGGGTTAVENAEVGQTSLPVDDASMFESAGGQAISGPNILTYTGKHNGGIASTVAGNVAGPTGAPTAAVTPNVVGDLVGAFQYQVAFANSQGETTPGPASGTVTGVAFTPPGAASVAATSSVIGKLFGIYLYVVTYVTSLGETTAGSSFGRTAVAVAAPGVATLAAGSTIGRLIGTYGYRVTFVTPVGETEGGTTFSRAAVATSTPSAPSVTVVDTGVNTDLGKLIGAYGYKVTLVSAFGESAASSAGSRTAVAQTAPAAPSGLSSAAPGPLLGTYGWKVAFVGPDGKESLGTALSGQVIAATTAAIASVDGSGGSNIDYRVSFFHPTLGETAWSGITTVGTGSHTVTVSGLPTGCGWKLHSTGGGSSGSGIFYTVATINPGTTTFLHGSDTGPREDSPLATLGKTATFTIPVGPTGTIARRIYRTRAGGSAYYLCGEVGDNSTTSFTDETPDTSLVVGAPTQNLNGEQHTVSSLGTGPTGTTKRYLYRTEAGGSIYYFHSEIPDNATTSVTDNKTDAELDKGRTAPVTATMGDQHALTSIPTGPTGTLGRRIYRTLTGGSIYYLLHEIPDNSTTSYTDNKADVELVAVTAPATSTAGGESHSLTSIPTGPTGTLARNVYRTIAGGSSFKFVGQLTDNVATTLTDNLADAELGGYVPVVNTAGANTITVSSIPTGGAGVTQRILYRTDPGGSIFRYLTTIDDNVTTSFVDNLTSLGRLPQVTSTIGALAGDTTLVLNGVTGLPTAGWFYADSQLIRYTGISATTLTGIPASGLGAILGAIKGGLTVVSAPFLSGVSGIGWAIERGASVRLYVQRDDAAAQATLAAREGGSGIHKGVIDDDSIITVAGLTAAADAELAGYSSAQRSITFRSRDPKLRSGKTLVLNLGAPTDQAGSFLIQRVVSSEFDIAADLNPMRDVMAAPVRLSFQDVLRRNKARI